MAVRITTGVIRRHRADPEQRFQVVAVRQHQIQQHQVDASGCQAGKAIGQITGRIDGALQLRFAFDQPLDKFHMKRIVLDKQDTDGLVGHAVSFQRGRRIRQSHADTEFRRSHLKGGEIAKK